MDKFQELYRNKIGCVGRTIDAVAVYPSLPETTSVKLPPSSSDAHAQVLAQAEQFEAERPIVKLSEQVEALWITGQIFERHLQ
jgi:hypothetical protein